MLMFTLVVLIIAHAVVGASEIQAELQGASLDNSKQEKMGQ